MNVYIMSENAQRIKDWFSKLVPDTKFVTRLNEETNLAILESRLDIPPNYYEPGGYIGQCTCIFHRSREFFDTMYSAVDFCSQRGITMIGIGSGAQLLYISIGGKLIQHVSGHMSFRGHSAIFTDFGRVNLPSTHHQIINPSTVSEKLADKFKILGVADPRLSVGYFDGNDLPIEPCTEVEAFLVQTQKSLSIGLQFHPEVIPIEDVVHSWFLQTLNNVIVINNKSSMEVKQAKEATKPMPSTSHESSTYFNTK